MTTRSLLHSMLSLLVTAAAFFAATVYAGNTEPPAKPVKLIFIHHSVGGGWLSDELGGLAQALRKNNYRVSDATYGWGPNGIGDRTDIPDWLRWFRSAETPAYMKALYSAQGDNPTSAVSRSGENEIVMFKSCFPNSNLAGNPHDLPNASPGLSVGYGKYVYNELLQYFGEHPDKLFIAITAPPLRSEDTSPENAANARAFNNWLVNDWLKENHYTISNVGVFDFYNILTAADSHHTVRNGEVQHITSSNNTLYYPTKDSHPAAEGTQRATEEFVPLLNAYYHRWKEAANNNTISANQNAKADKSIHKKSQHWQRNKQNEHK